MGWSVQNNRLVREFVFDNFVQAVAFVDRLKDVAEGAGHHPDILIHSYNRVKVMLFTHSEGKVTKKDHLLARRIDVLARKVGPTRSNI